MRYKSFSISQSLLTFNQPGNHSFSKENPRLRKRVMELKVNERRLSAQLVGAKANIAALETFLKHHAQEPSDNHSAESSLTRNGAHASETTMTKREGTDAEQEDNRILGAPRAVKRARTIRAEVVELD